MKFGLISKTLRSDVSLKKDEIRSFIDRTAHFRDSSGSVQLPPILAQITLTTASRSLQEKELREKLDTTFTDLYHDLDDGFRPTNLQKTKYSSEKDYPNLHRQHYSKTLEAERKDSEEMFWNLMTSVYKDATLNR